MDLAEKKHVTLFAAIVLILAAQPFARGMVLGFMIYDMLAAVAVVAVLLFVFEGWRERWLALAIAVPVVGCNWMMRGAEGQSATLYAVAYHGFAAVFFFTAVAVILRDAFRKNEILVDQIFGGVNGFLIAGVAWGNLYLLTELLSPGSFAVSQDVAFDLADEHSRRFLFNFVSFATLTGSGYSDVTPVGRTVCTLTWLESMFGQFYVAVIIGLLVGLKMASTVERDISRSD